MSLRHLRPAANDTVGNLVTPDFNFIVRSGTCISVTRVRSVTRGTELPTLGFYSEYFLVGCGNKKCRRRLYHCGMSEKDDSESLQQLAMPCLEQLNSLPSVFLNNFGVLKGINSGLRSSHYVDQSVANLQLDVFELATPLFDQLYNFAHWLTQDRDEAEDLVQEAYVRAVERVLIVSVGY